MDFLLHNSLFHGILYIRCICFCLSLTMGGYNKLLKKKEKLVQILYVRRGTKYLIIYTRQVML